MQFRSAAVGLKCKFPRFSPVRKCESDAPENDPLCAGKSVYFLAPGSVVCARGKISFRTKVEHCRSVYFRCLGDDIMCTVSIQSESFKTYGVGVMVLLTSIKQ